MCEGHVCGGPFPGTARCPVLPGRRTAAHRFEGPLSGGARLRRPLQGLVSLMAASCLVRDRCLQGPGPHCHSCGHTCAAPGHTQPICPPRLLRGPLPPTQRGPGELTATRPGRGASLTPCSRPPLPVFLGLWLLSVLLVGGAWGRTNPSSVSGAAGPFSPLFISGPPKARGRGMQRRSEPPCAQAAPCHTGCRFCEVPLQSTSAGCLCVFLHSDNPRR